LLLEWSEATPGGSLGAPLLLNYGDHSRQFLAVN
jgi:hypothetical protein